MNEQELPERNFRALWGGCKLGDRCQCTRAAQQGACENRDEGAIARVNANVALGVAPSFNEQGKEPRHGHES